MRTKVSNITLRLLGLGLGALMGKRGLARRYSQVVSALIGAAVLVGGAEAYSAEDLWPPAPPLPALVKEGPGQLPDSVTAENVGADSWSCVFGYRPAASKNRPARVSAARTVALVGSFNGWNGREHELRDSDGDGVWNVTAIPAIKDSQQTPK